MWRKWSPRAMARPATKELGAVLRILRAVRVIPLRNSWLMASVLLLLLLPCNLLVMVVPNRTLSLPMNMFTVATRLRDGQSAVVGEPGGPPAAEHPEFKIDVDPLRYVVADLSNLVILYLAAVTCKGKNRTLGAFLSKIRRSWRKVAISFLYIKVFYFTCTGFFIGLAVLVQIFKIPTLLLLLLLLALLSVCCLALVVFLYLGIAFPLSLVITAVEEDKCGLAALGKAVGLTRGKLLQGLLLTALCAAVEKFRWTNHANTGGEMQTEITALEVVALWSVVGVLADLSVGLFRWVLWTVYYYECGKSHGLLGEVEGVERSHSHVRSL